jgi:hypothetical protein
VSTTATLTASRSRSDPSSAEERYGARGETKMPWTRHARSQHAASRPFSATTATRGAPSPDDTKAAASDRRRRETWAYVQRAESGAGEAWRKTRSGWAATRCARSSAREYPDARIAPNAVAAHRVRSAASGRARRKLLRRVRSR